MSNTVNKVEENNTTMEKKIGALDKELDKQDKEFTGTMSIKDRAKKEFDDFVYMDNVKRILEVSQATEENVILYGPGGYGKSEISLAYFKKQDIEPYVITMGSGMTIDRLFGGLDIPAFNKTGKLEYLVENSFMNSEYVIFEELFDAPDFILEQLKDILSSGLFRNGNQIYKLKTKMIICCTNKTREEFSKNNSLKALMERFPLETKVVWKDHTEITYKNLLTKKLGFADPMLTYILEQFSVAGTIISPRIAIKAANIIAECGPESLTFIADFNGKTDLLKAAIDKFESFKKVKDTINTLATLADKYKKIDLSGLSGITEAGKVNTSIQAAILVLKGMKIDDSLVKPHTEAIKLYESIYNKNKKELDIELVFDDKTEENPF